MKTMKQGKKQEQESPTEVSLSHVNHLLATGVSVQALEASRCQSEHCRRAGGSDTRQAFRDESDLNPNGELMGTVFKKASHGELMRLSGCRVCELTQAQTHQNDSAGGTTYKTVIS